MSSSGLSGYSLHGYQSFFSCSYGRKPETVHEKHLAARVAIVSTATAHLPFFFFWGGGGHQAVVKSDIEATNFYVLPSFK